MKQRKNVARPVFAERLEDRRLFAAVTASLALYDMSGGAGNPIPQSGSGTWTLVMDTNLPDHPEGKSFKVGDTYQVTGRSMLVLQLA